LIDATLAGGAPAFLDRGPGSWPGRPRLAIRSLASRRSMLISILRPRGAGQAASVAALSAATRGLPGGYPAATRGLPGGYPAAARRLPGGYPAATRRLPGRPADSRRLPGGYPAATRRLPGGYPAATRRLPGGAPVGFRPFLRGRGGWLGGGH